MKERFDALDKGTWTTELEDPGTEDWQEHWALDGHRGQLTNTPRGMVFASGPNAGDHGCHAVLWSRQSFAGDLKVSFDFTRLDTINRYVCILYMHANGIGEGPYEQDIHAWSHLRDVPYMKTYFENMDMLHISFAAFGNDNDEPDDYVRVRRYPVRPDWDFSQMEVDGTIFDTNRFLPGATVNVCFIKTEGELAMRILGDDEPLYHWWDISTVEPTKGGPIGIRQMFTKCSRYANIRVETR